MERLTKREYGEITYSKNRDIMCGSFCNGCSVGTGDCDTVKAMVEKLAELEDLEEQGRLLRLPCKVGSNIYRITDDGIDVAECREITVADKEMYIESNTFCDWISFDEIGKTVFLTEAEAKLAEMEENHEGVSS